MQATEAPSPEFLDAVRRLAPGVVGSPYIPHFPHPAQLAFLSLTCKEALFGGAAGPGKTDALLMAALQYVHVPGYSAILFRRTFPELSAAGGLIPRSHEWLRWTDAVYNVGRKQWTFPSGAMLSFAHIQRLGDIPERGPEHQFIGYDELTTFMEPMYRKMFSRLRRPEVGPLSQVPLRMRGGTNPGGEGHTWVKQRFIIEGIKAGRVFVPARIADNPSLDSEAYIATLREGLDSVSLARMLEGDWEAIEGGSVFDRACFGDPVPHDSVPVEGRVVRAWDLAGTDGENSAWTVGVRLRRDPVGMWWIEDVVRFRARPGQRDQRILQTAHRDGYGVEIVVEQEPADAGIKQADDQIKMLAAFPVRAISPRGDKVVRASPVARQAEAGNVRLVEGPWVSAFLDELNIFPTGHYKDQVDALTLAYNYLATAGNPLAATSDRPPEARHRREPQRLWRPAGSLRLR